MPASTAPAGRRERKKARVRQRLYRTAVTLFRTRGFDETPVEAITEAADTAKGTFFNYFPTKEHVLAAYHDEMTGHILARMDAIERERAEDAVQEAMQRCADWVENDPVMGQMVVEHVFSSPALAAADRENSRRFLEWFRGRIEDGTASGELRPDLDVALMLSMLAAVLSSTMNAWVLDPDGFNLRDTLRRKTGFLFVAGRCREGEGP